MGGGGKGKQKKRSQATGEEGEAEQSPAPPQKQRLTMQANAAAILNLESRETDSKLVSIMSGLGIKHHPTNTFPFCALCDRVCDCFSVTVDTWVLPRWEGGNKHRKGKQAQKPITRTPVSYVTGGFACLLYTSPSPRDKRQSRMPSSA